MSEIKTRRDHPCDIWVKVIKANRPVRYRVRKLSSYDVTPNLIYYHVEYDPPRTIMQREDIMEIVKHEP